jgi:peptidoglycan/xylan/chitin deacetylase (PgdA/CDA1 family)
VKPQARPFVIGASCVALAMAGWAFGDVSVAAEDDSPPAHASVRRVVGARAVAVVPSPAHTATRRAAPPPPAKPVEPARYRPVGCVERGGAVAHFNGPSRREVALTFDDGPSTLTLQFVRMLWAERVRATFFMLGEQLSLRDRKLLAEELRDGDALGDHSWSHPNLALSGEVRSQLAGTKGEIESVGGYTPCVFRPPYGAFNSSVLRTAASLGLATIVWDVDPRDWALPGIGSIEATVLAQVKPGSIVLSHDGGGPRAQTLAAYPHIIAALRRRGYRFVTVPQLLGYRTIYRRCRRDCGESAIQEPLPPGSIVEGPRRAHIALESLEPAPILSR